MKEKDFVNELTEIVFEEGLIIPLYYSVDDEGSVKIDEEGIRSEFELKLNEVKGILNK